MTDSSKNLESLIKAFDIRGEELMGTDVPDRARSRIQLAKDLIKNVIESNRWVGPS